MERDITQDEINTLRAIKLGALSNKSDETIGKEVGLTGFKVSILRQFLGYKKMRTGLFNGFRKLNWNEDTELYQMSAFSIPNNLLEEIGLKPGKDYKVTAHAEKGAIRLEILQM